MKFGRAFTTLVCGLLLIATVDATAEPPNIVLILADDMGYGDVHALNPDSRVSTPHLDRLAGRGMTFTDAHTPSAVCTPTRYGLLTGRYCWRTRLKRGVLDGYGEPLMAVDRETLASFLAAQGYACGIVGKWHLGLGFIKDAATGRFDYSRQLTNSPNDYGFRFSHVIPASLDFPPYVFVRNGRCTVEPTIAQAASKFPPFWREGERAADLEFETCLDQLTHEAVEFIRRRAEDKQPFFLYFPLTAPHKPVLPHRRFRGATELGPYGDFVTQVDATVGQVLAAIAESGVADETLVIYTSDNGSFMYRRDDAAAKDHVDDETIQAYRADRHRSNFVFRGTKADIWEGGHRVPFFVRWPGTVAPGSRSEKTICLTDVFATLAELVDAQPAEGAAPDSFSFLPQLAGRAATARREPVVHHSASGMFAIRSGKWKLVLGNGSGGRENPKGKPFERPYQLFDLSADISETRDLADQHPDVVRRLEKKFRRLYERTETPLAVN